MSSIFNGQNLKETMARAMAIGGDGVMTMVAGEVLALVIATARIAIIAM